MAPWAGADLHPGETGSWPRDVILLGDRVFFTTDDGGHDREGFEP